MKLNQRSTPSAIVSKMQRGTSIIEMVVVLNLLMATVILGAMMLSIEIWGENERDITEAAVHMLESGHTQTRNVEFKLADPVSISVRNNGTQKVQISIEFGDSKECMESIVYLTQKYRGENGLMAETVESGAMKFAPPKTVGPTLIESSNSLCELSTRERKPVRIDFLRT